VARSTDTSFPYTLYDAVVVSKGKLPVTLVFEADHTEYAAFGL